MHSDFFLFSFGHFEDVRLAAIDCLVDLTKSEGFFVIFSLDDFCCHTGHTE